MITRIIWIGKNSQMAIAPRSAPSAGAMAAARPVVLPDRGRAAPLSSHRALSGCARGNLARPSTGRAPLFDATAGRWLNTPSAMMADAGAAAELRNTCDEDRNHPARFAKHNLTDKSPAAPPTHTAAGRLLRHAVEALTVALGLMVFGVVAGFLMVLA